MIQVSETVTLISATVQSTGFGAPPQVVSITHNGGGTHTVQLSGGIEVGHWTKIALTVKGVSSLLTRTTDIWVGHLPCNVNQDGTVSQADVDAFSAEWNGQRRPELIDINCDGVVNISDATAFGDNWNGRNGRQHWGAA